MNMRLLTGLSLLLIALLSGCGAEATVTAVPVSTAIATATAPAEPTGTAIGVADAITPTAPPTATPAVPTGTATGVPAIETPTSMPTSAPTHTPTEVAVDITPTNPVAPTTEPTITTGADSDNVPGEPPWIPPTIRQTNDARLPNDAFLGVAEFESPDFPGTTLRLEVTGLSFAQVRAFTDEVQVYFRMDLRNPGPGLPTPPGEESNLPGGSEESGSAQPGSLLAPEFGSLLINLLLLRPPSASFDVDIVLDPTITDMMDVNGQTVNVYHDFRFQLNTAEGANQRIQVITAKKGSVSAELYVVGNQVDGPVVVDAYADTSTPDRMRLPTNGGVSSDCLRIDGLQESNKYMLQGNFPGSYVGVQQGRATPTPRGDLCR